MVTALILIVLAAIAAVLILLAVVVVGIRKEPRSAELGDVAASPVTALVRRLTGLSVRRPTPTAVRALQQRKVIPPRRTVAEGHNLARRREEVNNRCRHTPSSR
jgi:hypothetical protein